MKTFKLDEIKLPFFSDDIETFIIPVLGNRDLMKSPFRLAKGWRYFENIIILQKVKNQIYRKVLNFKDFLKLKNNCKNSNLFVEEIYNNLVARRLSNININ